MAHGVQSSLQTPPTFKNHFPPHNLLGKLAAPRPPSWSGGAHCLHMPPQKAFPGSALCKSIFGFVSSVLVARPVPHKFLDLPQTFSTVHQLIRQSDMQMQINSGQPIYLATTTRQVSVH